MPCYAQKVGYDYLWWLVRSRKFKVNFLSILGNNFSSKARLGNKYADAISEAMLNMEQLSYLGASNNRLTDYGIKKLFIGYKQLPLVMDISNNRLSVEGVERICTALSNIYTQ